MNLLLVRQHPRTIARLGPHLVMGMGGWVVRRETLVIFLMLFDTKYDTVSLSLMSPLIVYHAGAFGSSP